MLYFLLVCWVFLALLFVYVSNNLLLSLIILEIISFFSLFIFVYSFNYSLFSDYYLIVFFSIFVIEGVIGLSGLIILVFFTGSDYISMSSIINI